MARSAPPLWIFFIARRALNRFLCTIRLNSSFFNAEFLQFSKFQNFDRTRQFWPLENILSGVATCRECRFLTSHQFLGTLEWSQLKSETISCLRNHLSFQNPLEKFKNSNHSLSNSKKRDDASRHFAICRNGLIWWAYAQPRGTNQK